MNYACISLNKCTVICALSLALAACPKDQPGDSDSNNETGTSGSTSSPTSGDSTPTGSDSSATGGDTSTLCQEACVHLAECGSILAPTMGGCVSMCEDGAKLKDTPACESSVPDWYTCMRDAPCEDTHPSPSGVCAVAFADYAVSCSGCPTFIDRADELCIATIDCTHGFVVDFTCKGDTCTCTLDSEPFASCPAASVCAGDDAALRIAAEACCGMPFDGVMLPGGGVSASE